MPVENGLGWSEEWTPEKQRLFGSIVKIHLMMSNRAMQNWGQKRYYYFDLHAGVGIHSEYGDGSPLIFARTANEFRNSHPGFIYSGLAVECNRESCEKLIENIDDQWFMAARHGDNRIVLSEYSSDSYRNAFGLVYCDPTNPSQMPFVELANFFKYWQRADLLIALSATQIKRAKKSTLENYLSEIRRTKKNWMVREPFSCFQWTFIYGTNGPIPEWHKEGFYSIDTKAGQNIFSKLNKPKGEEDAGLQLSLVW